MAFDSGDLSVIGKIINYRYEVLEKIGDGPLFSVYKSRDKVLNRLVALKTSSRTLAEPSGFGEAVVDAYRGAMSLSHPNIAKALDADCVDGECFVACEFARGVNVKERVRRAGPIAAPLAVDIMIPVLAALEYAHSMGVYHGDLGAQDIVVSPDGEVKVTDFGLSNVLACQGALSDRYVMRSVHYQAPEVIEGSPASAASDVYSAGVILYEMLTGQLPFDGTTAVSVAMKKVKEVPANPRTIITAVPKSLSDIVMRAIEPDRSGRYTSATAMLADLRAVSESLRTGVPVASSPIKVARSADEVMSDIPERSFKSQFMLLLLLFVVVCSLAMGTTFYLRSQNRTITVPPLLGKTVAEAEYEAKRVGIILVNDGTQFNPTYPEGRICAVSPAANAVVPASDPRVKIRISSGPGVARVPDVVGKSEPEARNLIKIAGLMAGMSRQEFSDSVPVNYVISQDPEPGMRRTPGSTVEFVVSKGPNPETQAPPVPNPRPERNQSAGEERGFKVGVEVPASADGPQEVRIDIVDDRGENTVYSENREPGDRFDVPVTVHGSSARIKTYVGGSLVSDETR